MEAEHLLIFPDRETAEDVAADLEHEGFDGVRVVREALAGEDDSEDHEWAVHLVTPTTQPYAAELAERARDLGGWYDTTAES